MIIRCKWYHCPSSAIFHVKINTFQMITSLDAPRYAFKKIPSSMIPSRKFDHYSNTSLIRNQHAHRHPSKHRNRHRNRNRHPHRLNVELTLLDGKLRIHICMHRFRKTRFSNGLLLTSSPFSVMKMGYAGYRFMIHIVML